MPVEVPTSPDTTTAPALASAPAASLFADFDAAFPDDGLDSPATAPSPKPASKPDSASVPTTPQAETDSAPTSGADAGKSAKSSEKSTDGSPAKPAKPAEEEDLGEEFTPPQVAKPSELRGWALRQAKKAKQATERLAEMEGRLRQLEAQPPRQAQDNSALAAELADAKKRLEQYESDLRLTKYERSQEYAEKFQKPYQNAVQRAYREVKELIAFEPNPEDPDNPRERTATQADFDEIYGMPLGQATRLAKQRFGDAAMIVLQHRQQIRQLAEAAYGAVEEYKTKGTEAEKRQQAEAAQREQGMGAMFQSALGMYAKRNPQLFSEIEGDTEGNGLLAKGRQFASMVFAGNEGLNPQQVVMRDARAFNWLSAYPRLARDVKKLQGELAEANKTIEGLRGSGPGKPKASVDATPKAPDNFLDAFERAVPD